MLTPIFLSKSLFYGSQYYYFFMKMRIFLFVKCIPHYVTSDYFYAVDSALSIVLYVPFLGEDILLLN